MGATPGVRLCLAVWMAAAGFRVAAAQGIELAEEWSWEAGRENLAVLPHGWRDLPVGAWVEVEVRTRVAGKETVRVERRTLKGFPDPHTAAIEVTVPGEADAAPVAAPQEDEIIPRHGFEPEDTGAQVLAGRRIWPIASVIRDANGAATVRVWQASNVRVPGGVVRREASGAPGPDGRRRTWVREVADWDRWAGCDGRRVLCTAWRESERSPDGTSLDTEELQSYDLPGLVLGRVTRGTAVVEGKPVEFWRSETALKFCEDPGADEAARRRCDAVRALFEFETYGYEGFAAGSRIEHRSVSSDREGKTRVRRTVTRVLEPRKDGALLESTTRNGRARPDGQEEYDEPRVSSHELSGNASFRGRVLVRLERDDSIDVGGRAWPCGVFTVRWPTQSWERGKPRPWWFVRVWFAPGCPANRGILREESGVGPSGSEPVLGESHTVTALDSEIRVGERSLRCWVIRRVMDHDAAEAIMESESWSCDAVPGRLVRHVSGRRIRGEFVQDYRSDLVELDVTPVEAK